MFAICPLTFLRVPRTCNMGVVDMGCPRDAL